MSITLFGRWTLLVAISVLGALAGRAGGADDRWYEIWISGSRAGWLHETTTTEGDRVTTRSEMRMAIGRADTALEISTKTEFVETVRGEPLEMRVEQRFGPAPVASTYEFREDDVLVRTSQNGSAREMPMPKPEGEWLSPAAAAALLRQRLASGAEQITIRTLDPSNGLEVVVVTRTDIAPAEVEYLGETVEGFRANARTKVGPVEVSSKEWFDNEGTLLRSETSVGGMEMVQVASTRERALVEAAPPELMLSTFVKPEEPITRARTRSRAVFGVSLSEGSLPPMPPSAYQSVEARGDGAARVTVDLGAEQVAPEDTDREKHLAPTTYADAEDEVIADLTSRALAGAGEAPRERAEALRRFVYRHIRSKDLTVAFATASETARSGEGDCSEHAVLLAAMLRAAQIPSRVAAGVVYVDEFAGARGVFGYHMWTQALLDTEHGPAWFDLDPSLDDSTPYDATHIAFATSSLAEGDAITSLAAIAPLLGTLQIRVEEMK